MKKLLFVISGLFVALSLVFAYTPADAAKPTAAKTNLLVGRPTKGMYCADPAGWIKAGYKIYVWGDATPVKAQAFDTGGHLINPANGITWKVQGTGETGSMTVLDSTNKVYTASPKSLTAVTIFTGDSNIDYTADGKTFSGVIRRWNATCDGCHTAPPAHAQANAGSNGVSTCRTSTCHPHFGDKMMVSHAYRVSSADQTSSNGCYQCHPSPCYSGIHANKFPNDPIGCVTCHGTLADGAMGNAKWPGQPAGFPRCENCHTSPSNAIVPYAQNTGKEYKDSVGHGKAKGAKNLCITCHNSMHMETKPTDWGDGTNNNCSKCHTTQPTEGNMGLVCGNCHVNSWDPHLVKK